MGDYRQAAQEWREAQPYGEGIDPEAINAVEEHAEWLQYSGGRELALEHLRGVWMFHAKRFKDRAGGEDAAWMVAVEGSAKRF